MRLFYDILRKKLEFVKLRMNCYYNDKKFVRLDFWEGNKIYFICKNFKIKRPNNKFDFKKLGLFKILKKVAFLNYEL